jgi:uncharacterized Zn finger protein (UPF0148 family)
LRAVRAEEQVLVCPDCQQSHGWAADVDHCPVCGSTRLVRRLGATVCRACEESATAEFLAVESTVDTGVSSAAAGGRHRRPDSPDLSAEVATAIERILGREPEARAGERPAGDTDGR